MSCVYGVAHESAATDYHVGPGQQFTSIGQVAWYNLRAGDTVYIHYRSTPYREKFLISGQGTESQWIRVLGVPGPNGELPIISGDGATTSTNMHYRWQTPNLVQWDGIIQIAARSDDDQGGGQLPAYIEIANLQVQDAYPTYRFTAENGQSSPYEGFAACIYARSVQHLLVRNNVLTNCGQGFYNWTGSGSNWWDGLQKDTVLTGNYIYNNGYTNSYTEHQTYTESDGVTIEYNRFGPNRAGALGSQIKDRSAGTVIRYNLIESAPAGWMIDLVEPQESYDALGSKQAYKQAFVYGNILINKGNYEANMVHWNEDHQANQGRATLSGGKLFFYDNTVLTVANQSDIGWDADSSAVDMFNVTYGAYDCPPGVLPGVIDVRNNIFAMLPRTAGSPVPRVRFGYCGKENFNFGKNWVTPGFEVHGAQVTGTANLVAPASNLPSFLNVATNDLHLAAGSSAIGIGGALAPEVTQNALGLNLAPTMQYVYQLRGALRESYGIGSDAGAFAYSGTPQPTPTGTPTPSPTATTIPTVSPTPSATPTRTPTPAPTATPTRTPTPSPSASSTPSPTPTASATPSPTATATLNPTPTATLTPQPTATLTPQPTATPKPKRKHFRVSISVSYPKTSIAQASTIITCTVRDIAGETVASQSVAVQKASSSAGPYATWSSKKTNVKGRAVFQYAQKKRGYERCAAAGDVSESKPLFSSIDVEGRAWRRSRLSSPKR